ncbi:helix-turn-helix transcriptional regulator [Bradyrhizobium sp. 25ACV]
MPTLSKRGLTKQEAADYCGCNTLSAFDRWIQKGLIPKALPGTSRWDLKALDAALDRASGLVTESAPELTPYQRWKVENARKAEAA